MEGSGVGVGFGVGRGPGGSGVACRGTVIGCGPGGSVVLAPVGGEFVPARSGAEGPDPTAFPDATGEDAPGVPVTPATPPLG